MNIELMKRVRGAIADEATAFDMGQWGVGVSARGKWWPVALDADRFDIVGDCGTPACVAGWAIRLGRPEKRSVRHPESFCDVEEYAESLLGLDESRALFHRDAWPAWARRVDGRAGAVAMLDLMIAGHNPWNPPEGWVLPT